MDVASDLIKPTSFVDEAQSQFEYISIQFFREIIVQKKIIWQKGIIDNKFRVHGNSCCKSKHRYYL